MCPARFLALALLMLLSMVARAQAQSPTERKRREIQEQLGLPKKPTRPPSPPGEPPPSALEPPAPAEAPAAPGTPGAHPEPIVYAGAIHNLLIAGCRGCHGQGGVAAHTRFLLRGTPRDDFASTRAFIDPGRPRQSPLLVKATGETHGGGRVHAADSRPYRQLLKWISDGARFEATVAGTPAGEARPARPRQRARADLPAPAAVPATSVAAPLPPASLPPPTTSEPSESPGTAAVRTPDFATSVYPLLETACRSCHNPAGAAGATRLRLSGAVEADYVVVLSFLDRARPSESPMVIKGAGVAHGGGVIYPSGGEPYKTIVAWIASGAALAAPAPAASEPPATAPVPPPGALAPAPLPIPPAALPGPSASGHPGAPGLGLPFGFQLNGRFDLNYERRGLGRDSGWGDGQSVLRSYHQFLFLSRKDSDLPVRLSVEIIQLQIWEASYAHHFENVPLSLVVRGGKMLVPFGGEPIFHQLYGGLAGFDQKVLPPVWAQEGVGAELVAHAGPVSLSSDLFAVRGYRLKTSGAVLNLQNDFSSIDDAKLGVGHRLGASWSRLSGWYSLYFNPLGFGRRLVMQAIDVTSGRWREAPIMGRFSASVGILRADVSGGGSGSDYYHFASYWQGRFYFADCLYLQYRQGLRTFNNRRGVILDDTRLDAADGSSHTVGLVGRWHGLSAGLHYTWNFEKADEIDDDFFRAVVAIEF